MWMCVCVCAFRVCARNPEEARRRRISGLSRQTFVSDLLFFDTTRQDFRYFEIDADNELSLPPHESSLVPRVILSARRTNISARNWKTPGWRSWIRVTRANSWRSQRQFTFTSNLFQVSQLKFIREYIRSSSCFKWFCEQGRGQADFESAKRVEASLRDLASKLKMIESNESELAPFLWPFYPAGINSSNNNNK